MLIRTVYLKNWRSHRETRLEFSKGTNLLVGIIGSGKSSVLEAICYGLYGTFPALTRRRTKLSQVASEFTGNDESVVEVVFEYKDKKYSVRRVIRGGKSDAELRENGKLLEAKSEAVTAMVEHILGVDYDMFTKAIYSEQNEIDYFFSLNPGERKKQIDGLIGIDKFETGRANTLKLVNRLTKEVQEKRGMLDAFNKNALVEEMRLVDEEIRKGNDTINVLNSELEKLRQVYDEKEKMRKELEHGKEQFDALSKRKIELSAGIQELSKSIKGHKLEEVAGLESKVSRVDVEIANIRKSLGQVESNASSIISRLGELENLRRQVMEAGEKKELYAAELAELRKIAVEGLEVLEGKFADMNEHLISVERELSGYRAEHDMLLRDCKRLEKSMKDVEELMKEWESLKDVSRRMIEDKKSQKEVLIEWVASLREVISTTSEVISKLKEEGMGVCPLCDRPLDKNKKDEIISKRERILKDSENDLEKKEDELRRITLEISELEEKVRRKDEVEHMLKDAKLRANEYLEKKGRFEQVSKKIASLNEEIGKLREEVDGISSKISAARRASDLEKKILELDEFLEKNKGIDNQIAKLREENENTTKLLREMRDALSDKEREHMQYEVMLLEVKKDIEMQNEVARKQKEISQIDDKIKDIRYDERELEMLRNETGKIMAEMSGITARIEEMKKNIGIVKSKHGLLSKQIREIEEKEMEISNLEVVIEKVRLVNTAIVETQVMLRNELVGSINEVMNRVWGVVYPYGDIVQVRLEATDMDYVLKAKRANDWINIEGSVSGGERASIALVFRIALSIVLAPNISLLVLDEPTHNLDENGVRALSEILRDRLPKIISQSFIITHDEKLKEGASGKMYIFTRNKTAHGPTQVISDDAQ
ncbi:MAG: AAA family ATPase [Candidatus Micrarchaeia archaeon]